MDRLFGTLELRSTDDERREFEGIANTASEDDHGTVIEPAGARFTLPMPLLWQHDQNTPVGEITHAELRGGKWYVRGSIRKVSEPGIVKDATDQAWHNVKYKLVRGLSIGFKELKRKGNRFLEWAWRELSLVTIPSNQDASILTVRSAYLAASGESNTPSPGVSGVQPPNPRRSMTIAEQIQQHENSRAAKVAQKETLIEKASAEGRTLDESESETFDTLDTEIRSIDGHLTRLATLKRDNEQRAVPVNGQNTVSAVNSRGGVPVVSVKPNAEPGIGFARHVMALAACNGNKFEAAEYAKRAWGDAAEEVVGGLKNGLMTRSAVAAGTTTAATWALPLVPTNYLNEFLEYLRPATLLGRIPGLRRVPFDISIPIQTAGGSYSWVGEGSAKPVTNPTFSSVTLGHAKAAGIIVITKELARSSSPDAQAVVRDELRDGMQQYLDTQFIDSSVAASAGVSPASITNGVAGTATAGATEANMRTDLKVLLGAFATANLSLNGVVLLMSENTALGLSLITNAVGASAFPEINRSGGNLLGYPVVISNTVGNQLVAVHAPSILFAEDGLEIDMSDQASLQMDSAPSNPSDATTVMVSLWQRNLIGLRAERFINWGKARTGAVQRITAVAYA